MIGKRLDLQECQNRRHDERGLQHGKPLPHTPSRAGAERQEAGMRVSLSLSAVKPVRIESIRMGKQSRVSLRDKGTDPDFGSF